jgi:hypothetical protein
VIKKTLGNKKTLKTRVCRVELEYRSLKNKFKPENNPDNLKTNHRKILRSIRKVDIITNTRYSNLSGGE